MDEDANNDADSVEDDSESAGTGSVTITSPYTGVTLDNLPSEEYYLYNVESGLWLQNNDRKEGWWTTAAELGSRGLNLAITAIDGGYQINPSFSGNHSVNQGIDENTGGYYLDTGVAVTAWTFEAVSVDGDSKAYYIKYGDRYMQATDESDGYHFSTSTTAARHTWQIVPRSERMARLTSCEDTDATWLVKAPDFAAADERNSQTYWIVSCDEGSSMANFGRWGGQSNVYCNSVHEMWNDDGNGYTNPKITQTISLPNGIYKVRACGTYCPTIAGDMNATDAAAYAAGTLENKAWFFAGDQQTQVPSIYSVSKSAEEDGFKKPFDSKYYAGWVDQVARDIHNGYFKSADMTVTVTNGTLDIGAKVERTKDQHYWMCIDNFEIENVSTIEGLLVQYDYTPSGGSETQRGWTFGAATGETSATSGVANAIAADGALSSGDEVENLKVKGKMTAYDLAYIKELITSYQLNNVDLSEATLSGGAIANDAFKDVTGLESILLPSNLTSIGVAAFQGCNSLKTVTVAAGSNITIGALAFMYTGEADDAAFTSLTFGDNCAITFGKVNFVIGQTNASNASGAFWGNKKLNVTVGTGCTCTEIPDYTFYDVGGFTNESLNALLATGVTRIGNYAFNNLTNHQWPNSLTLPATVEAIGISAFGISPFSEIHVTRSTPPSITGTVSVDNVDYNLATAYSVDGTTGNIVVATDANDTSMDSFRGVTNPNYCTVYFDDDAGTGTNWKSYLYADASDETGDLNLPFARLLTKELKASSTTYDVYPQEHAVARLHRTLKAGWNTMVLPFGATNAAKEIGGASIGNAQIIKNALDLDEGGNFKLAVYRGYNPTTHLFRFRNYIDYTTSPIDAFEAFLVRIDQADLDAAKVVDGTKVFSFRNVDLNYKYMPSGDNTGYTRESLHIYNTPSPDNAFQIIQQEWTHNVNDRTPVKAFAGQLDTDRAPFNDGNSDYANYIFTGTYSQFIAKAGEDPTITEYDNTRCASNHTGVNGEVVGNLFDYDVTTKFCVIDLANAASEIWISYHAATPAKVTYYKLTSANDSEDRNPKAWVLEGSTDGSTWETIDTQSGETFADFFTTNTYKVETDKYYEYFRLRVTERNGNKTQFQLSEFSIQGIYEGGSASDSKLTTNDGFIQHSTADGKDYFYWCVADQYYGVRGYTGWFHYVGNTQAKPAMIQLESFDTIDEEPTDIVAIDREGREHPMGDVYGIDGRLVRRGSIGTEGLRPGLYIVNGRKVVVK